MMDKMIIKFAQYAFKDILELLHDSGIDEISMTKEDNELKIVISSKEFESIKSDRVPAIASGILMESATDGRVSGYKTAKYEFIFDPLPNQKGD